MAAAGVASSMRQRKESHPEGIILRNFVMEISKHVVIYQVQQARLIYLAMLPLWAYGKESSVAGLPRSF